MKPAVFLDRDNTLIHNDGDLGQPDQVRLIDGVPAGLRALRDAGFHLVVVTNQAGVARGRFTEEDVDAVHQRIARLVDEQAQHTGLIDRFYYCPFHPEGTVAEYCRDHLWRKPHPGMILQASRDMAIDLEQSWVIGDQERDIQSGRSAGCRTILISSDPELIRRAAPHAIAANFEDAVRIIVEQSGQKQNASAAPTANGLASPAAPSPSPANRNGADFASLRRTISELTEEIRSDRMRRADFTLLKMTAGLCQLFAILLAMLGLLQLANTEMFFKWMIGAGLAQMLTMTLLILDLKG